MARASSTKSAIRFTATLLQPRSAGRTASQGAGQGASGDGDWTFLLLPRPASAKLSSRGQVTVDGAFNGAAFRATLEPDGQGGHWLMVERRLRQAAGAEVGDVVTLELTPVSPDQEPEPRVPADLRKALATAPQKARDVWADVTPIARRDWIHWIVSAKKDETRAKRIATACEMLAKGKRRPCCFDRSGMYGKSLSCPVADDESQ